MLACLYCGIRILGVEGYHKTSKVSTDTPFWFAFQTGSISAWKRATVFILWWKRPFLRFIYTPADFVNGFCGYKRGKRQADSSDANVVHGDFDMSLAAHDGTNPLTHWKSSWIFSKAKNDILWRHLKIDYNQHMQKNEASWDPSFEKHWTKYD